jgi:hypothetical protein
MIKRLSQMTLTFNKKFKIHYFSEKIKKEEILLYILDDKYSVKPDKEFRITHTTKEIQIDSHKKVEDKINIVKNESPIKCKKQVIQYGKSSISEITSMRMKILNLLNDIKRKCLNTFFPREYPFSVKKGYLGFSTYTFFSNVCFNTMNFITTQVLISAMNLNISKSTGVAISAGMNWALKEGLGQLGSIAFSTKYVSVIDKYAKPWRIASISLVSVGCLMEASAILIPTYFLFIATVSTITKLIAINANIFSRTAVIEFFSKQSNIVDLSNKFSLQNNVALLLGNLIGFGISLLIDITKFQILFPVLCGFSIINILTSIQAIKYINFDYFNFPRICIFLEEYFKTGIVLNPEEVGKREPKLFYYNFRNFHFAQKSADKILKINDNNYIVHLFELFREKNYFILVKRNRRGEIKVNTFLRVSAVDNDIYLAFLSSIRFIILAKEMRKVEKGDFTYEKIFDLLEKNQNFIDNELDKKGLLDKMKNAGWLLQFSQLEDRYTRYHLFFKNLD